MKVFYNIALTSIGVGLGILTVGYFSRPKAAAVVRAFSAYLLLIIRLRDLKL